MTDGGFRRTQSAGAVHSGWLQLPLSTGVLGSSHHLHGFGDFLDVLDGLQADGDWGEREREKMIKST